MGRLVRDGEWVADSAFDVIVIGAGVVGCSIARSLSQRQLATLNVDALPAAGYGSTSSSSAIVRPFYSHVTAAAMAHEARGRWLDWDRFLGVQDAAGLAEYTESGMLVLMTEGGESDFSANLAVLDEVGVDYELLDAAAVTRLYPDICLDTFGPPRRPAAPGFGQPSGGRISGGILVPAAGYVSDPQLAAHNLQMAAAAHGAQFRFGTRIASVLRNRHAVTGVVTDGGERLIAPVVVNASGPHSGVLNRLAGIDDTLTIRTKPHRHEVVYLGAPSGYVTHGNGVVVDLDTGAYYRPDGPNLLIGTTDPDCDPPEVVDPDAVDGAFTEQWTVQAYRGAQRFPSLGIENRARGVVGLYDVSDDWIPLYDRSDLEGFFLAIGTSGNQFKNAPVIGDVMAAIILATLEGRNHDATPARLFLPGVRRTVDLSFYSRRRAVQATRSVLA